ncbi:MAG: hypothetical protein PHI90_10780 [Clostridia bacterium]|nr:hypothetical protein [Clostridia bacterium]
MRMPFLGWILLGIPEGMALMFLAISLVSASYKWKNIFVLGFVYSLGMYLIRLLPFTPGVHSLLGITEFMLLLILFEKTEVKVATVVTLISFISLLLFECIFYGLIIESGLVTQEIINTNLFVWVITGYPQVIFLFLLGRIPNTHKLLERLTSKIL